MTLNTRVVIEQPYPAPRVFHHCRQLLGCTDAHVWEHERTSKWSRNPRYGNILGQGLPALLWLHYGPDGPLLDDDEDDPEERQGFIAVHFDTAYGYARFSPNGAGCEDLHAWLIRELGRWLDERGLTWQWQNEFTGEWHRGSEGLGEFGDADRGALRGPLEATG